MATGSLSTEEAMWTPPRRKEQLLELLVFCLLIVPSLVLSLFMTTPPGISFPQLAIASIARDIGLVCLIAFFLWRNGESVHHLGWQRHHALREVAMGVLLFVPLTFTAQWVEQLFMSLGLHAPHGPEPFLTPRGPLSSWLPFRKRRYSGATSCSGSGN